MEGLSGFIMRRKLWVQLFLRPTLACKDSLYTSFYKVVSLLLHITFHPPTLLKGGIRTLYYSFLQRYVDFAHMFCINFKSEKSKQSECG